MKSTSFYRWIKQFLTLLLTLSPCHLATVSSQAAETVPDVRIVTAAEAQVWCGPSTADGLYPTNVLHHGDRVQVERELDSGWLVIRPPAGSFSWINSRFVQHISSQYANYVVIHEGNDVPVLIGSSLKRDRPNKIGVRLPRGAQVRAIGSGRGMTDEEGTWLPIEPPEGEVRYLRKEAVPGKQAGSVSAGNSSAAYVSTALAPAADGDTLWRDAVKADRTGRLADAIRLYRLAGDANLSTNPTRADEAYRRAHWIEQANSSTNSPSGAYYYPDGPTPPPATTVTPFSLPVNRVGANAIQPIGGFTPGAANAQLVSTSPEAKTPRGLMGRLKRAWKNEINRRYYLMDKYDHPTYSVMAGPGVDLSGFDERNVELWGDVTWDKNRRNWLLTVTNVREIP